MRFHRDGKYDARYPKLVPSPAQLSAKASATRAVRLRPATYNRTASPHNPDTEAGRAKDANGAIHSKMKTHKRIKPISR
jgi:hypothetical protein